jgi:hypothetical protein
MSDDTPLRCIVCGGLLDEDPRERDPTLKRPPNVHPKCLEEYGAELDAEASVEPKSDAERQLDDLRRATPDN